MMYSSQKHLALLLAVAGRSLAAGHANGVESIYHSWGELSVYKDNAEDAFGVQFVGLPDGCQVESVSTLQRHAQRFPDSVDGALTGGFAGKLANFTAKSGGSSSGGFSGPLEFLNDNMYVLNDTGFLTGEGGSTEFARGVSFWNRYGRTLYNASTAQLQYEPDFANNGTKRPKVALRTTSQSRIQNTQINWALGFFGPSFNSTPDQLLTEWQNPFSLVIIPEGGKENNTLASYDSCFNDNSDDNAAVGTKNREAFEAVYLRAAVERLQQYAPSGFNFTYRDLYAMQLICAYEYAYLGMSDYCGDDIFTTEEWKGFDNALSIQYYYLYSFGNPTGRAQGIGYVQELLARLEHEHISSSNSSVNSTLDATDKSFPLGQQVYADFSHDDIIISVLTAMSMDYFKDAPTTRDFPAPKGHFKLSDLTPFGANLITETIGCASASPKPLSKSRVQYSPTQHGYDADDASHKFVRMRLNNGILPLNTIRGGMCGNSTSGRLDGLCDMESFLESQKDAFKLSNYDYACFGNYTIKNATSAADYDGTVVAGKTYH